MSLNDMMVLFTELLTRKEVIVMKKINMKSLYAAVAVIASLIAATVATSACMWFFYQPQEPISLQE
jgi:AgrD protein